MFLAYRMVVSVSEHLSPIRLSNLLLGESLYCHQFHTHLSSYDASRVDASGRSGLHYVVQVILHLLDPTRPEFSATFVGRLIITFVKKATGNCQLIKVSWFIPHTHTHMQAGNALGEHLELLLRSVLSKMQSVQSGSVMQSLLVVFAYLIMTQVSPISPMSGVHCNVVLYGAAAAHGEN